MQKLIAIETATHICSVALTVGDKVFEKKNEGQGVHSAKLFVFVDQLLKENNLIVNDLDGILLGGGPGSYTGLRIGAAGVKGLLFGSDVPLYTIGTLESFAFAALINYPEAHSVHAVIDARREHLYHLCIKKGEFLEQNKAEIRTIKEIEKSLNPGDVIVGTGIERISEDYSKNCITGTDNDISALNLIKLWQQANRTELFTKVLPQEFEPEYLTMNQVNNSPNSF
jgi:tRNA threonylcarbamoyladenosine biosynthesis protein TsaB